MSLDLQVMVRENVQKSVGGTRLQKRPITAVSRKMAGGQK